MKIYLVRHVEYENPDGIYPYHLPVKLSVYGQQHAHILGKWFYSNGLLRLPIYTSPIQRAVETATILAQHIDSKVRAEEKLIERWCLLQGKKTLINPQDEIKFVSQKNHAESIAAMQQRLLAVVDRQRVADQDSILVSHGDPLSALYAKLLAIDLPILHPTVFGDYIHKGEIVVFEFMAKKIVMKQRIRLDLVV